MTVHDFDERLAFSHSQSDAPWWGEVYRKAFPTLTAVIDVRDDGWAQRGGIDRLIVLNDGTALKVDEKVRTVAYPDILLERWSDKARRKPGWMQKELTCDFVAYAFVPTAVCYLLPWQLLRRAWIENGREWIASCRLVEAQNRGYVTESVAVPIQRLLDAVRDAMVVSWTRAAA